MHILWQHVLLYAHVKRNLPKEARGVGRPQRTQWCDTNKLVYRFFDPHMQSVQMSQPTPRCKHTCSPKRRTPTHGRTLPLQVTRAVQIVCSCKLTTNKWHPERPRVIANDLTTSTSPDPQTEFNKLWQSNVLIQCVRGAAACAPQAPCSPKGRRPCGAPALISADHELNRT